MSGNETIQMKVMGLITKKTTILLLYGSFHCALQAGSSATSNSLDETLMGSHF